MRVTLTEQAGGMSRVAAELDAAGRIAPDEGRKVVQKGSLNIKNDWRDRWSDLSHLPALPRSINYDTTVNGSQIIGEIGPEHGRRQAELAPFIENEYGSTRNSPRPGGAPALAAEKPKFERALEDLALKSLGWS